MMGQRGQDALLGALLGLMFGVLPAVLAAGAFITWRLGGDLRQIDLLTYLRLFPGLEYAFAGDYGRAALLGLGVIGASVIGGVALLWRKELTTHGTARWADRAELCRARLLARRAREIRGPVWGKLGTPRSAAAYLSSEAIVHSLVAAPTGSGKGVGVVIPTLLTYKGSTVVLDVKGENYEETARARHALGDRVFKFAPYAPDRRSHRYNPFDAIAAAPERRRFAEALRLGSSLLGEKPGTESWINGSREIFAATAIVALERGQPTIAAVYDLLTTPGAPNALLAALGAETTSGEAASVFNRFAGLPEKSLGGYVSIMFEAGLRLWANPDVRDATAASDFEITSFRSDPASVFLCVSQKDLEVLAPLIRLLFQQMFTDLQETERGAKDRYDVLFLLDEFASLGKMQELGRAITTVRSSGAHLMLIVQSLANLQVYGREGAANFMGNCELQLFMAPTDTDTPKYISEAIGDRTYLSRSRSWRQRGFEAASVSERAEGAALIRPEQIRLLGPQAAIALVRDMNPIALRKVRYFEDRRLAVLYERQAKTSLDVFEPAELPSSPRSGQIWGGAGDAAVAEDGVGGGIDETEEPTADPEAPSSDAPKGPRVVRRIGGTSERGDAASEDELPEAERGERLDEVLSGQEEVASEIDDICDAVRRALLGPLASGDESPEAAGG
ncbi:MAG: type IV secretion system protein VirD4 [Rhodovulum sulfidophilum]|uniref:Type IV secretion system protein VirD4 n=1 Tax=Rhodovulum sulfidophilum TaxID=35806 RepID=A0A2W5MZQ5_RHOSU|nr:MAG: type IV secretion system protein VirD4 [Rhodovulum sulfidophilum]